MGRDQQALLLAAALVSPYIHGNQVWNSALTVV